MSEITHLLVDRVNVLRLTEEDRGHGRWLKDYVPFLTDLPFRISPLSARELRLTEQMKIYADSAGYCEDGVDLDNDDVIVVISRSGQAPTQEVRYRIMSRMPPSLPKHLKVVMQTIQKAGS